MSREEKIQQIGKKIQFQLNKLKELNVSLDLYHNTFALFDNNIKVELSGSEFKDHLEQAVFEFHTSFINQNKEGKTRTFDCEWCEDSGVMITGLDCTCKNKPTNNQNKEG
jgi:hypothetical protein